MGQQIIALEGHGSAVRSAAFSPGGTRIVTASNDNTARVWDISTIPKGNILQIACRWLPDHNLDNLVLGYPIKIDKPICETDPPFTGKTTRME